MEILELTAKQSNSWFTDFFYLTQEIFENVKNACIIVVNKWQIIQLKFYLIKKKIYVVALVLIRTELNSKEIGVYQ